MDLSALIQSLKEQVADSDLRSIISFDAEILSSLSKDDTKQIIAHVGSTQLMRLPEKEIVFFEFNHFN